MANRIPRPSFVESLFGHSLAPKTPGRWHRPAMVIASATAASALLLGVNHVATQDPATAHRICLDADEEMGDLLARTGGVTIIDAGIRQNDMRIDATIDGQPSRIGSLNLEGWRDPRVEFVDECGSPVTTTSEARRGYVVTSADGQPRAKVVDPSNPFIEDSYQVIYDGQGTEIGSINKIRAHWEFLSFDIVDANGVLVATVGGQDNKWDVTFVEDSPLIDRELVLSMAGAIASPYI